MQWRRFPHWASVVRGCTKAAYFNCFYSTWDSTTLPQRWSTRVIKIRAMSKSWPDTLYIFQDQCWNLTITLWISSLFFYEYGKIIPCTELNEWICDFGVAKSIKSQNTHNNLAVEEFVTNKFESIQKFRQKVNTLVLVISSIQKDLKKNMFGDNLFGLKKETYSL